MRIIAVLVAITIAACVDQPAAIDEQADTVLLPVPNNPPQDPIAAPIQE